MSGPEGPGNSKHNFSPCMSLLYDTTLKFDTKPPPFKCQNNQWRGIAAAARGEAYALETEYKNGHENGHKHLTGSSTHTIISAYTVVAGSSNKHHSRARPAPKRRSLQAEKRESDHANPSFVRGKFGRSIALLPKTDNILSSHSAQLTTQQLFVFLACL